MTYRVMYRKDGQNFIFKSTNLKAVVKKKMETQGLIDVYDEKIGCWRPMRQSNRSEK